MSVTGSFKKTTFNQLFKLPLQIFDPKRNQIKVPERNPGSFHP